MTDRQEKMRQVQKHCFAKLEAGLYLDGHPHDEKALQYFREQEKKAAEAIAAFENAYGPLTMRASTDENGNEMGWAWAQDPWPWEKEAN